MKRNPKPSAEVVGSFVMNSRIALGISQADLGRAVGLSQTAVSRVESGLQELSAAEVILAVRYMSKTFIKRLDAEKREHKADE